VHRSVARQDRDSSVGLWNEKEDEVKGTRRGFLYTGGAAATAVGCLLVAASPSGAVSPTVGIGKNATLAELYTYLGVPPPQAASWAPELLPENCSKDWVVWSDGSSDPLPPADQQVCLGRWRGSNADYCRDTRCGCDQFRQCSIRWAADVCEQSSSCAEVIFQKRVTESQRPAERALCAQQARDRASSRSGGGVYRFWWRVGSNASFNFVCEAQYAVTPLRSARVPDCGCQTATMCEAPCRTEAVASAVGLTRPEAATQLEDQNDQEDQIDESSLDCETRQDEGNLSVSARYTAMTSGSAAADLGSRLAFQKTKRLMHELDMVRPTAEELVHSALASPGCGVSTWLTTSSGTCADELPFEPFVAANNCARLLASHVVAPTITEDVYRLCTDALRAIAQAPYADATCRSEVQEDVAQLARALRSKANSSASAGSLAPALASPRRREVGP